MTNIEQDWPKGNEVFTSLSLRDYFATHCPITWTEAQEYNNTCDPVTFFTEMRYEYADAMIANRAAHVAQALAAKPAQKKEMTDSEITQMATKHGYKALPTVRLAYQGFYMMQFARDLLAR